MMTDENKPFHCTECGGDCETMLRAIVESISQRQMKNALNGFEDYASAQAHYAASRSEGGSDE